MQIIEILPVTAEWPSHGLQGGASHGMRASDFRHLVIGATTTSFDRRLNQAVQRLKLELLPGILAAT